MLEVVEDAYVHIVGRTIDGQQFAQTMLVVVLVGELEDGLARLTAEPHDGRTRQLGVPLTTRHEPGTLDAGQFGGSVQIDIDLGVAVHLQEGGRHLVGNLTLHGTLYDIGLLSAPCQEEDVLGRTDGADTHGDTTHGDIAGSVEGLGSLTAAGGVEEHQSSMTVALRTHHVEGYVACQSHAQHHDVDASQLGYAFLVVVAVLHDILLWDGTVDVVDVALRHVDLAQEKFLEVAQAAVGLVLGDGVILIDGEDDDVMETQSLLLVHVYELAEEFLGGVASRESQHAGAVVCLLLADDAGYVLSHLARGFLAGGIDVGGNLLETCQYATLDVVARAVIPRGYVAQRNLVAEIKVHGSLFLVHGS